MYVKYNNLSVLPQSSFLFESIMGLGQVPSSYQGVFCACMAAVDFFSYQGDETAPLIFHRHTRRRGCRGGRRCDGGVL